LMVAAGSPGLTSSMTSLMYPLVISSLGMLSGLVTMIFVRVSYEVDLDQDVEKTLKATLTISTAIATPLIMLATTFCLPASFAVSHTQMSTSFNIGLCAITGLWAGLGIGFITEYYTSHSYRPVREVAESQQTAAATGIIFGLALGYQSTVIPGVALALTLLISHSLGGMYGIAIAALGMLATLTVGLTIDCYGPISDNAGGIVEMSGMGNETRQRTDALDAAGNTTAAIGKGFAIGSAALVAMALFGAFCERAKIISVDALNPWAMFGTMIGTVLPFAFSAVTMKAVGTAANAMVNECRRQFPQILAGSMDPDYTTCIQISTQASFKEMFRAGAMVLLAPTVGGVMFGKNFTAGLLTGSLYCGVLMAVSMSNSGGAWDNAKKFIEGGGMGTEHLKGSNTHKNAVVGDTVGDPLKDTSGPSLNILVKLGAIMSLVFADIILSCSSASGGPRWAL